MSERYYLTWQVDTFRIKAETTREHYLKAYTETFPESVHPEFTEEPDERWWTSHIERVHHMSRDGWVVSRGGHIDEAVA